MSEPESLPQTGLLTFQAFGVPRPLELVYATSSALCVSLVERPDEEFVPERETRRPPDGRGLCFARNVAFRADEPLGLPSNNNDLEMYFRSHATVALPNGYLYVDTAIACVPVGQVFGTVLLEPTQVYITWAASDGVDPTELIERLLLAFDRAAGIELGDEADPVPPDVDICGVLDGTMQMIMSLGNRIKALQDGTVAKQARADREQAVRMERRLTKHVAQLQGELDTSRAVAERQRGRADLAERRLRQLSANTDSPTSTQDQLIGTLQARIAELEATQLAAALSADQAEGEMDRLREETHRLRQQLEFRGPSPQMTAVQPSALPDSLLGLGPWATASLAGRVVIHPKALRSARKSNFADPALVYRVLKAMADLYWPLRFERSANARAAWEQFLAVERLSCGPTGAAISARQTAAAYQVTWEGRQVTLDLHVQGHSGRDEARSFRVYFCLDQESQKIVIGHLPSHLPNTHS